MDYKRLILPFILSLLTIKVFSYIISMYTGPAQEKIIEVPGSSFQAPTTQQALPLKQEVDFKDHEKLEEEDLTSIVTQKAVYTFSNRGGCLNSFVTTEYKERNGAFLTPLSSTQAQGRDQACFLVAFDTATPYMYRLVSKEDQKENTILTYQSESEGWIISKKFSVSHTSYSIKLSLQCTPSTESPSPLNPRILFSSPYLPSVENNVVQGYVEKGGALEYVPSSKEGSWFWIFPPLVGLEDKYFATALVKDGEGFGRRCYFRKNGFNHLQCVLEGKEITNAEQWEMEFYVGPKEQKSLAQVDTRLEKLLSFGWFHHLSVLLIRLLEWFYSLVKNYGLAIVLLTIMIRLPFIPFSVSAQRKMEEYEAYMPTIERIRNKYRNDRLKQTEEILKFEKEHNISSTTKLLGCLPQLFQLPIMYCLYRVLSGYICLYQAPFFLWIKDLSAKDPYYLLPVLMGICMIWFQSFVTKKQTPQAVLIGFLPAIVFVAFATNLPSGLVLYLLCGNLLSLLEVPLRKIWNA